MARDADVEMRWVEAWDDLYDIIGDRRDVPCQLPDWSVVVADECRGWLQQSAYQGDLVRVEAGWVGHRRGVIAHRWPETVVLESSGVSSSTGLHSLATTWEGLEAALLDLPKKACPPNAIATFITPNGDTLSVGIAGRGDGDNPGLEPPLATVEYNHASQDPPYLVVVGDPTLTRENGGVVVLRFEGQWTEILRRNCVPVDVMIRVVKHFFLTGALPDLIAWEGVWPGRFEVVSP